MNFGLCTHWGVSGQGEVGCQNICPEIVYHDQDGHSYCVLHAPKFYVQPKGFYYGRANSFTSTSKQINKDAFKLALDALIQTQVQNKKDTVRFDKIYWPENFSNYLDSLNYPDKIFQFIDCVNLHSVSNSKLKSVRFFNNKSLAVYVHNLEAHEILVSGKDAVLDSCIRDSKIDSIVFHSVHFNGTVTINKIKPLSEKGIWGKGLTIKNTTFDETVKIEELDFGEGERDVTIEETIFEKGLYFRDNKISGWINLKYNKFDRSKAYFENIDLTRIHLTRHCLEYLRFANCIFPEHYPEMEKKSFILAEEVYRDLKKLSEEKKDYSLLSRWHFLEKEMALLNSRKENKKFLHVFLGLYKFLCGYGEKPSRALWVLSGYLVMIFIFLASVAVAYTGFHENIDWEIVQTFPFSIADFVPLFKTPTEVSLSDKLDRSSGLLIVYNLGAAIGRIFCIIQVGLFSIAIRNQLKR